MLDVADLWMEGQTQHYGLFLNYSLIYPKDYSPLVCDAVYFGS
jgi:hypothetical protein